MRIRKKEDWRKWEEAKKRYRKTAKWKAIHRNGARVARKRLKLLCLRAYGGDDPKCACCGERNVGFLTLDHVDGGGRKHVKSLGLPHYAGFYRVLWKSGFPNDPPLQILCYNCNMGRAKNGGICPHKTAQKELF